MRARAAGLIVLVGLAGCGYHLAGESIGLPQDVHSISVGKIDNHSHEYGLEKTLAFAMEREVHVRGHFLMVEDPAGGDAVLSGTIRDVRVRPVAYNSKDEAVQYELALVVDLTLTRKTDGRVLWNVRGLRETDEYSTSGGVVVSSSSQFQQQTLDAKNLTNPQFATRDAQRTSIELAESERRQAIDRLLSQVVRDVYNQMVEDF